MDDWNQVIRWTTRIAAGLYALSISLFALDAFGTGESLWAQSAAFMIHLLPTYVIVAALAIAWSREWLGGLIFLGLAAAFILFFNWNEASILIPMAGPLVLIGIGFLVSWWLDRKTPQLKF